MLRSAPPENPSLLEVKTAPLIVASVASFAIVSTMVDSSAMTSGVSTFIDRSGISQVTRAMPSASVSKRKLASFMIMDLRFGSHAFDDRGGAHAAADAQGDERRALAGALEFIERGAEDHRSRRAERVAHRDRPAVDVDLARIDVESLAEAQHDRRKSLVALEQIDVVDAHAGA